MHTHVQLKLDIQNIYLRKQLDIPSWGIFYEVTGLELSKNVLEGKKSISNQSRLKETKEMLQLKPICDSG